METNFPVTLYMKVLCNLEGKGFGGVLTQQVSEPARTFGNTPLNPEYITFMLCCEIHFMGVRCKLQPFHIHLNV